MTSLLADFAYAVARSPQRVAIVDGKGRKTTFQGLSARAEQLSRIWHAKGVRRGDRVLLAMPLEADLYASLAALWSLGATAVLPEPAMGLAGLRHAARATKPSAFCSAGLYGVLKYALPELWPLRHLRPGSKNAAPLSLPEPKEGEIALISFTSGTTGKPKAIPRSHGFLKAQYKAIAPLLLSSGKERDLVAFPVFVLINIASGRTSVLPGWKMSHLQKLKTKDLEQWIEKQEVSRALLPPILCERLSETGTLSSLHTVFTGGGPVFPDILARLKEKAPDLRVISVYGSTEAEPIAHLAANDISASDTLAMNGGNGLLVGHPVKDVRVRIIADEILVAGPHVNAGYLDATHDAENKVRDGETIWHRTGDAGFVDEEGRLWLLGRLGSQVSVLGAPVFPFSFEVAARQWQGVRNCALIPKRGRACFLIEGDSRYLPDWNTHARKLGVESAVHISRMPMDKRHASKIDRAALSSFRA